MLGAATLLLHVDDDTTTKISADLTWNCRSPDPSGRGPCIKTSLTSAESDVLRNLGRGRDCVEFGAAYGYSTVLLALAGTSVISVDPHDVLDSAGNLVGCLSAYGVSDRVRVVKTTSDRYCASAAAQSAGLVFVDGAHTAAATLLDLRCASRLLMPGGWIALHDWGRKASVRHGADLWTHRAPDATADSLAAWRA